MGGRSFPEALAAHFSSTLKPEKNVYDSDAVLRLGIAPCHDLLLTTSLHRRFCAASFLRLAHHALTKSFLEHQANFFVWTLLALR
jgi:hypothetical protein